MATCCCTDSTDKMLLLVFVTMLMLSGTLAAPTDGGSSGSCAAEFHTKFQELLALKRSCRDSMFNDCCQIANSAHFLNFAMETNTTVVVQTINDVCTNRIRTFTNKYGPTIQARCDPKDGWLVILRRKSDVSPLVNFRRKWVEYENGFGDLNTEFWYGLKNIHCLTQRDDVELMIELKRNDGTGITWTYQTFRVDGPETNYVLHIGGAERIEGTGSDNMAYHNGQQFSTFDRDNDQWGTNCAANNLEGHGNGGGWWYKSCAQAPLTLPHNLPHTGTNWYRSPYFPNVEMKIRPKTCLVTYKQSESCE